MKVLLAIVLGIISVAYPILVYFGIQHVSPAVFSLVLLGLALARFFIAKDRLDVSQLGLLLLVVPFSLGLLITNSEYLLKLYPAVVSLGMSILFGASLWQDESFIERMARLGGKEITPRAKRYTRRLTLLWAFLLLFNVVVVLYFAFYASFQWWALYCGLLSYFIFGGIFVIELLYRQYYIHKYGA